MYIYIYIFMCMYVCIYICVPTTKHYIISWAALYMISLLQVGSQQS